MHNRFLKQIQGICWRGKVSKEREAISMYELENDDEIEIDLRELFLALRKKLSGFCLQRSCLQEQQDSLPNLQ